MEVMTGVKEEEEEGGMTGAEEVEGEERMRRPPNSVSPLKTDFQGLVLPAPLTGEVEEGSRWQLVMKTMRKNCESAVFFKVVRH